MKGEIKCPICGGQKAHFVYREEMKRGVVVRCKDCGKDVFTREPEELEEVK